MFAKGRPLLKKYMEGILTNPLFTQGFLLLQGAEPDVHYHLVASQNLPVWRREKPCVLFFFFLLFLLKRRLLVRPFSDLLKMIRIGAFQNGSYENISSIQPPCKGIPLGLIIVFNPPYGHPRGHFCDIHSNMKGDDPRCLLHESTGVHLSVYFVSRCISVSFWPHLEAL